MSVILRYSTEFGSFGVQLRKTAEDRPILSATEILVQRILLGFWYRIDRESGRPCQKR